jgi:hypothetical protein
MFTSSLATANRMIAGVASGENCLRLFFHYHVLHLVNDAFI